MLAGYLVHRRWRDGHGLDQPLRDSDRLSATSADEGRCPGKIRALLESGHQHRPGSGRRHSMLINVESMSMGIFMRQELAMSAIADASDHPSRHLR
jgi:hypothetical protein